MRPGPAVLDIVQRGVATLQQVVDPQLLGRSERAEIDSLTVRGRLARVADVDTDTVLALRADGHVTEIRVGDATWSLVVRGDSPAKPSIEADGRAELALPAGQADELEKAVARGDAPAALAAVGDLPAELTVRLRNDPRAAGAHWITSEQALTALLQSSSWIASVIALADGPRVLVVGDWLSEELVCDGLRLCGPRGASAAAAAGTRAGSGWHTALVPADGRPILPSPAVFAGAEGTAPADRPSGGVRGLLHGVARCLSWYWLANEVHLNDDGSVSGTVLGARTVALRLVPTATVDAVADVALFDWATSGSDPGRLEAVRQAASLALVTDRDLPTAAAPALRTARSLHELSRRGSVGEALAARRAARDAALGAARQAADAARQAAGKAVERVVLQAGALGAVVLARAGGLLGAELAIALALLVAALTAVAWAVTARVELPSAKRGLQAQLEDLQQYRDTLSQDDIDAVKGLKAGIAAAADLAASRKAVHLVYGASLALSIIATLVVALIGNSDAGGDQPTPVGGVVTTPEPG